MSYPCGGRLAGSYNAFMRSLWTLLFLPLLGFGQPRQADVVIYGATSSGIAAAVQVSRMGKSVLIVDPGTHLGGLTTGGFGWTDIGNKQVIGGIAREFYAKVKAHYDKPESWKLQPRAIITACAKPKSNPLTTPCGPSSRRWPRPSTRRLIAQYKIPVVMKQRLDLRPGKGVIKNGARITAIVMEDGTRYTGRMFIDATYEGDLMAKAGREVHHRARGQRHLRREVQRRGSGAQAPASVPGRAAHLAVRDAWRPGQRPAAGHQPQRPGHRRRGRQADSDLLLPPVHDQCA